MSRPAAALVILLVGCAVPPPALQDGPKPVYIVGPKGLQLNVRPNPGW